MDIIKKVVNKEKKFFGDNKKGTVALRCLMDRRGERTEGAAGFQQYGREEGRVEEGHAMMTVGQDVSTLFIDIINCMQQGDIEMKKLVYLYLINYADEKPDLALLAVQSFIRVWME